jgi:uncharacterized protein (TIGR01777 family)
MSDKTIAIAAPPPPLDSCPARPLRIVIPGGEGYLGRLLARRFLAAGHTVITLSRSLGRPHFGQKPWTKIPWDGRELGCWTQALEEADVLLNLSGRSVDCRYNARNREEILNSRVESTLVLGKAIQSLRRPPRLWLNASTATIYRHSFDRPMEEISGELGGNEPGTPRTWRFSIDVARQWEEAFLASKTPSTRKVALRAAMVMSPAAGGIFTIILRLVRLGLGGAWGSGRQYMSWIHELDFFRAIEFLIAQEEISGPVNLAAPHPLPNHQFLSDLRQAWGIRVGLPAPPWMLAIGAVFLRTETELLLKSRRVVPAILRERTFAFRFPEWPEAARDLVRSWKQESSGGVSHAFGSETSGGTT